MKKMSKETLHNVNSSPTRTDTRGIFLVIYHLLCVCVSHTYPHIGEKIKISVYAPVQEYKDHISDAVFFFF